MRRSLSRKFIKTSILFGPLAGASYTHTAAEPSPEKRDYRNVETLTLAVGSISIRFSMQRTVCILALALGCLISSGAWSADKPITLVLEQTTTLRVGDLARLHIPSDSRYLHSGADGAWRDVLVRVRHAGHDVTFRAVRPGSGVIIVSPNVTKGDCISCATLHYFINVVPHN